MNTVVAYSRIMGKRSSITGWVRIKETAVHKIILAGAI